MALRWKEYGKTQYDRKNRRVDDRENMKVERISITDERDNKSRRRHRDR